MSTARAALAAAEARCAEMEEGLRRLYDAIGSVVFHDDGVTIRVSNREVLAIPGPLQAAVAAAHEVLWPPSSTQGGGTPDRKS